MARTLGIVSLLSLAAFLALQAIVTTDRERVEAEILRLAQLARDGGPEAVDGILDAFAADYRGTGAFDRDAIERRLRAWVESGRIAKLGLNDFEPIATEGDAILVPLLGVSVSGAGGPMGTFYVRVTFEPRGERWKIVDVSRWRFGR